MALFYDNNTDYVETDGVLQAFERVYCLRFSEFTDSHWSHLDRIYQSLPGWLAYGADGCPFWFGTSEAESFLWASVEPSGLLVHGVLPKESWLIWDEAFRQHESEFPTFEV
jgi:hypothetical protein